MNSWLKENTLEIIIWAWIFGILFAAYIGYEIVNNPTIEIKTTVIDLPASDSPARSYGKHAGDAP